MFCHQAQAQAQFDRNNQALYRSSFVAEFLSGVLQPGILFFGNLVFVGVAIVGGLGIFSGQVSLGLLQAFVQYSRQLTQPMSQMSGLTDTVQSALASTERVFELLDAPEMGAEPEHPAELPTPRGHIVFENVTFR
nr:ABC transporter transmembrane domain-containing protein [uncultured Albidiferax sp.]